MIREVAAPYFGIIILEDTDTKEYFFEGLCGQVGMYPQCIKMTQHEKELFIKGELDLNEMLRNICRKMPGFEGRIIPTPKDP